MEGKRSKEITFYMVGHAHIDPVWLWDWREGYETVKATFRSALDRLQENPDMVFVHSSASHYRWMEHHPAMMQEIRDAVARGQWEPVGGWWVEPDVNIPSGEALARQGLYGQRYFEKAVGKRARVAFLPDSFGHPVTLPQLFKQAGMDYFVFMRPGKNEIPLPSNLFWWESPDGSRVLTARVECYNTNPVNVEMSLTRNLDWRPADAPEWISVFGVGNHGGGPTKKAIANVRELAASPEWPTLKFGRLDRFFDGAVERQHPVVDYELQHHARGCYSAYSPIKTLNRQGENLLLTAEKFAVFARPLGYAYPGQALTEAWQNVLFNQFHDILAGSSIPSAYRDSLHEMGEALAVGGRALYGAMQTISQQIDTRSGRGEVGEPIRRTRWTPSEWTVDLGDGVPVVVFNPSPWTRREVFDVETNDWGYPDVRVLDHENRPVLSQLGVPESETGARPHVIFTAEVPPMGYRVYRLVDEPALEVPAEGRMLRVTETELENDWWRLTVDPGTGALRSLYDKVHRLELLAGAGAQLVVIDDPTDTWGHGVVSLRHASGLFQGTVGEAGGGAVEIAEAGPVRATLRIALKYGKSEAVQTISLYRETPQIDGRLTVDWHEQHKALKLAFPFAVREARATFSAPYGHVVRPAAGEEEPVQQWLDVSGQVADERGEGHAYGVAVLNDCKYGADVLGGEARITVLRSPVFAHHDPSKLKPGVHYPYQDQGEQTMRWALVPHAGSWQTAGVVQAAHDLNTPMPFVREYAHDGALPKEQSYLSVTPPDAVVVTAVKQAEESSDLIVRLYEPCGQNAAAVVSVGGVRFDVTAAPHQIKTYRISSVDGAVKEVNFLEE
ncbi:MAG TPA: glycoside hydrolase family 38 C-terminal domain-containing protein [Symbiobacteriaceae bacterium]|nr:glycoside hydrolase family 38 C-terminal domain-containing protein [Symbiobacteriaceae bacterium]